MPKPTNGGHRWLACIDRCAPAFMRVKDPGLEDCATS
jgi:hypothetical protein